MRLPPRKTEVSKLFRKTLMSVLSLFTFTIFCTYAQIEPSDYTWYETADFVKSYEGQGWEDIGLGRLPEKAEKEVREAVWNLSKNSAGLGVRFETDSNEIIVEYQVGGNLAMNHMPATGVSGVDLYVNNSGQWLWAQGQSNFNDTVQYVFEFDALPKTAREIILLFPLYNTIENIRIGVSNSSTLTFIPKRAEKPIVVYGTSIAQGACASRPGMAWTNILSRKMDYPIVNLGFSGNGRLEPEVIGLVNEIDASLFILDCLPNLSPNAERTKNEVQKRIRKSVVSLRQKHPKTPILLVQHAGYSDGLVNVARRAVYETLNSWMAETFTIFKKDGVEKLYMLTREEIGLSNDAFVDGTHPTDLGMQQYANAYEKIINSILKP